MKRVESLVIAAVIVVLLVGGCSKSEPDESLASPTGLTLTRGDLSLIANWSASPDEGTSNFDHYNVYASWGASIADLTTAAQLEAYLKGTTVGHSFTIDGLYYGDIYYVHVRAVRSDGLIGDPSNEVMDTVYLIADPPTSIGVYIDSDSTAVIHWGESPDRDYMHFLGYWLYRKTSPFTPSDPDDDTTYVMHTIPYYMTDTLFTLTSAQHLERGVKNYYTIKLLMNDNVDPRFQCSGFPYDSSGNVMQGDVALSISGSDTIYEVGYGDSTLLCGFGFDDDGGHPYTMTIDNQSTVDIYLGSTNASDGPGQIAIKSPHQYSYHSPVWTTETSFRSLGYDYWRYYSSPGGSVTGVYAPIQVGQTIAIKTSDNHYAKIHIDDINLIAGSDTYHYIVFHYAYQPITGYDRF